MDNISQIKQKLDIVDVVSTYVQLKKSGKNYRGLCPFHGEKTPSFMVSPELQIYKCFGCGESGDMFSFIQKIEGVEFSNALEQLAERAGVKLEKGDFDKLSQLKKKIYLINELTTRFYEYLLLKHESGKQGLKYLKDKRRLNNKTIIEFRLGCAPDTWNMLYSFLKKKGIAENDMLLAGVVTKNERGYIDKFRNRIMFPLIDINKKIVGFTARALGDVQPKYLNTAETPIFHKNMFLYGLDKAKLDIKTEGALFVEGTMDVISAYQAGIKNLVAPLGTSLTVDQLKLLSRYTNDVFFCFDSDSAGINAIYRAIDLAEKQNFNIKVVPIPGKYKDLDELVNTDAKQAQKIVKNAISAYDFFVADCLKSYDKKSADGKKKIIQKLNPLLSHISNKILLEHYIKELSEELDTSEEILYEVFKEGKTYKTDKLEKELGAVEKEEPNIEVFKSNPESYVVALLLKSTIDDIRAYMYNLKPETFVNSQNQSIITQLGKYIEKEKKNFSIKRFIKTLEENLKEKVEELYLWELDIDEKDKEKISREIENAIARIKQKSIRKELQEITEKIKLAERKQDEEAVNKLLKKIERIKKELL